MLESNNLKQGNRNQGILMCCNTKQHEEMLSQEDLQLHVREKKETTHSSAPDTSTGNAPSRLKISLNERRRSMGDAGNQPSIKHQLSSFHPQPNIRTVMHQDKENAQLIGAQMSNKKTSLKHKKRSSNQPFLVSFLQEELQARLLTVNMESDPLSATLSHILASSSFGGRAPARSPNIRLGQGLPTVRSQFAPTQTRSHTYIFS